MSGVISGNMGRIFKDYTDCFAVIGVLSVSYIALKALYAVWRGFKAYLLSPMIGLGVDVKSLGEWAVVTGATDGIGKAYALELARRGMNIVLISRSSEKLEATAQEIESAGSAKTKSIPVDFNGGLEIYETISAQLSGLEIGVLVNNVGASYELPAYFHDLESNEDINKIIQINCCSVTFMTRIVLSQMLERKKGAIINISSLSGAIPTPLLTVYSGTKAYVDYFSRCLHAEYKDRGIIVQCVMPGFVATKMSRVRRASWIIPNPQTYVRSALATLGIEPRTPGYMAHGLQGCMSEAIPEWLYLWISMKTLLANTKRARQKRQKAQ